MTLFFGYDSEEKCEHKLRTKSMIMLCGLALTGLFILLSFLSGHFSPDIRLEERPVLSLVLVMILSGAVYVFTVVKALNSINARTLLVFVLFIGAVLRLTMIFSVPMLEDDFNRYLWDGAVTANGINPYRYSPEDVIKEKAVPGSLIGLERASGDIIQRINHPHIRSIYPPVTQALFALSYIIKPWSLSPWRAILLLFDIATLLLILYSLRLTGLPLIYCIIYWWNPLFVKEIYNSGHLDVLAFPFALGGMILASSARYSRSMLSLALGAGVKLWPALLAPLVLHPVVTSPGRLLRAAAIFVIILGALFIPIYLSRPDASSGVIAYGTSWENNDSIFRILILLSDFILKTLGFETYRKYALARVFAAAITAIWIFAMTYRKPAGGEFFKRSLFIIAFVFLISPTEFPWYYTWLLPFLALEPRLSLLTLTALLPLYYLRYYFEPRGMLGVFTNVIIWLEFVPVWVLIFMEWKLKKREVIGRQFP